MKKSKEELVKFREKIVAHAFEVLDTDKDGTITKDEFRAYMNHPSFPKEIVDSLMDEVLASKSGLSKPDLSNKDYLAAIAIIGCFIYADTDKDKKVGLEEATKYMTELNAATGKVATKEEIVEKYNKADENKDGFLNVEEFINFFDNRYRLTSDI